MSLKLYNTLSRQLEDLKPINPPQVKIYACGPTVYNYFHVGNGRAFLVYDMVRRYLEYKGYLVTFVQNLTDIEDKIINRAKEENISAEAVAKKYTRAFFEDSIGLGILPADVYPKATDHIPEMILLIQELIDKDRAYVVEGDVYYAVRNFDDYGKLSRKNIDDLKSGARVEKDERKNDPLDFALWKKAKPGEPFWQSPWGEGRPGWHIECSAMAIRYLGHTFDIHCGGEDLVFPHHENEIAQSEGATGQPFAKYWLHVAFLRMEGEKMSKSLGNFVTVREALQKYSAESIRYFMLSAHYRSPLDFSDTSLKESSTALQRGYNCLENIKSKVGKGNNNPTLLDKVKESFENGMDEDFNTPRAFAAIFELIGELNQRLAINKVTQEDIDYLTSGAYTIKTLGAVLGLFQGKDSGMDDNTLDGAMQLIIKLRHHAREHKDYATSDTIRSELNILGISLEDTPNGTVWKKTIK
jgi:cysteinyl-tRNA synthetase